MREIKFRIWDNHYKYMNYKVIVGVYGDWEKVKDDKDYTSCSMWIEPQNVDYKCEPHWANFEPYHEDIKLMQFTGLYDKNKTPIYEGDIVRINGEEIMYCRNKAGYGAFEFSLSKELLGHTIEGLFKRLNTEALIFEVIGNVWDNPDLLGE